jgi:Fe2+ transport system protein FeoA
MILCAFAQGFVRMTAVRGIKLMKSNVKTVGNRTLTHVPAGSSAKVVAVNGSGRITRRLMEMGVVPGVSLRVVKMAPFGDPIEIRLRGYSLAMRRTEAEAIEVAP